MSYLYYYSTKLGLPQKCPFCSKPTYFESPFLTCSACNKVLVCPLEKLPKKTAPQKIWHKVYDYINYYYCEKGAFIGLEDPRIFLFLLSYALHLTLIGIEDSNKLIPQKASDLQQAIRPFGRRAFIEFTHLHTKTPTMPNECLDFIFYNALPTDILFHCIKNYSEKVSSKGFSMGFYPDIPKILHTLNSLFSEVHTPYPNLWIGFHAKTKFWRTDNGIASIARKMVSFGDPFQAWKYLQIKKAHDTFPVVIEKAYASFNLGNYLEGEKWLRKAESLSPTNSRLLYLKAKHYFMQGKYDDAVDIAQDLYRQNANPKYLIFSGNVYRKAQKKEKLHQLIQFLEKIDGKLPSFYYSLGSFQQDFQNMDKAMLSYKKGFSLEGISSYDFDPLEEKIFVSVKSGSKYGPEYVNKLYTSIKRFCHSPIRFICLTDDINGLDHSIETIDIRQYQLEGWWNKALLFNKKCLKLDKPFIYIDLDEVIIDWLDPIFLLDSPIMLIRDFTYFSYNSSIMRIDPKIMHTLYEDYFNKNTPKSFPGDQDWITQTLQAAETFPVSWFISYRLHAQFMPPLGTKIVCFHGDIKPHNCTANWVKDYWK